MIKNIRLLRNIGKFQHAHSGKNINFKRMTLLFAENGRGKTTLAAVFRSLAQRDSGPIVERRRFGASEDPHVVIISEHSSKAICFEDDSWTGTFPRIVVFDDTFVEENVYSGLTVSSQQWQKLHDLILGPKAVQLQRSLDEQVEKIECHNREIRNLENALKSHLPQGFTLDDFCFLKPDPNIVKRIEEAQKTFNAAKEKETLHKAPGFQLTDLPQYDLHEIEGILTSTLETLEQEALLRIQSHLRKIGEDGEDWIAKGMRYVSEGAGKSNVCPFCGESIKGAALIHHYREYFSECYSALKRRINRLIREHEQEFGANLQATVERELRDNVERQQYWAQFTNIAPITLKTDDIFQDCCAALHAVLQLLKAKQSAPLEKMAVSMEVSHAIEMYHKRPLEIAKLRERLELANEQIEALKAKVNRVGIEELECQLKQLNATKIRYRKEVAGLCDAYLRELKDKSDTEKSREEIREKLDEHRINVFPTYEGKVNQLLAKFGTDFSLNKLKPRNMRSGSTTTYGAKVGTTSVNVAGSAGKTNSSFGTVLSAGDRTTLAFAFFLASLDQESKPDDTIVVIDDPISSMDSGRTLSTVQETRNLVDRFGQVIVLSHSKSFLCSIANNRHRNITPIEIVRVGTGSDFAMWNLKEESLTEHDRRHTGFQEYLEDGNGNKKELARNIRDHLEGYLRVTCPQYMSPGTPLGQQFIKSCRQKLGTVDEILTSCRLNELSDILEFAGRFHHETNPAWKTESIEDIELRAFVRRTLNFTGPSG